MSNKLEEIPEESVELMREKIRKVLIEGLNDGYLLNTFSYMHDERIQLYKVTLIEEEESDDGMITNPLTGRKSWL